jgi:Uma2 family endonuclease
MLGRAPLADEWVRERAHCTACSRMAAGTSLTGQARPAARRKAAVYLNPIAGRGILLFMAISTQIPVEEYLRSSYDPDCEYVDGEVLDRNVGEQDHAYIQKRLTLYFGPREAQLGIYVLAEWRMRIGEHRYRVPDFVIIAGPRPRGERVLSTPPMVAVEILSPEDRMSRMQQRITDYLAFGVRYVWVIDPENREAVAYTAHGVEKATDVLRTENPAIEIPLHEIFD